MKVLPQRLAKYGLTLNPENTRLIDMDKETEKGEHVKKTFDFLGFTHYIGKSRKGKRVLMRKTSSKKMRAAVSRMSGWLRDNRNQLGIVELMYKVNQKLRGHYNYYGITFNGRRLEAYYYLVRKLLHKWLSRRGGKRKWAWPKVKQLVEEWIPLDKPRIYHSYSKSETVK
jgi:hypothetical protein